MLKCIDFVVIPSPSFARHIAALLSVYRTKECFVDRPTLIRNLDKRLHIDAASAYFLSTASAIDVTIELMALASQLIGPPLLPKVMTVAPCYRAFGKLARELSL